MAISFTDKMENLVREDRKNDWEIQKKLWFVMDDNDAKDLRYPGKMKLEWSTNNGSIIA